MSKQKDKSIQKTEAKAPAKSSSNDLMTQMQQQISSLDKRLEDFFSKGLLAPFESDWPEMEVPSPKVDVIDKGKKVVVRAEVPGFDKDNIDVVVGDNTITLKGTVREEDKQEEGDFYRSEVRTSSFSRSLMLPAKVDASKVKAKFENGILEIKLPKVKTEKKQKIKID